MRYAVMLFKGDLIMIFSNASFIKGDFPLVRELEFKNQAPMFRKKFALTSKNNAKLYVCGLGYGYYYINGKPVSPDLFTAPVSDYRHTLWYNVYDVSDLLNVGENIIAVICGNGWYNESIDTGWYFNRAPWRDVPKFILNLEVDGSSVLVSDASWKCCHDGPIYYNNLRNGEYFDANLYDPAWTTADFDDSAWYNALRDNMPPCGTFRECKCEPIREICEYKPQKVYKTGENKYLFDIGQNISGYIRLTASGYKGDLLTIKYVEQINDNLTLQYNGMDVYHKNGLFQTDKFTCSGERITWSPKFAYHGFRYMEIDGIRDIDNIEVSAIFVHQDIKQRAKFECSNELLNRFYQAGIMASYSNMFYMITDCPTREKLGWANDAFSSAEQLIINFEIEKLYDKWLQDIKDAMLSDGALPGIIPTSGWGYHWGNGPVSDGLMFELPYKIYLHTGNAQPLIDALDYFDRYLKYIDYNRNEDGYVTFGLDDWRAPGFVHVIDIGFINDVLVYSFYKIAHLAAKLAGSDSADRYLTDGEALKQKIMHNFLDESGKCTINEQTAVSMMIYYDLYNDLEPLAEQLKALTEQKNFHHNCGMVGLRRLFLALNKCGLPEYAYKVLMAEDYPCFKIWFDEDATTLYESWECWEHKASKNHHMLSDFMSWTVKTLAGISIDRTKPGELEFTLDPIFIKDIDYVNFEYNTVCGKIEVHWKRNGEQLTLNVNVSEGVKLRYHGEYLNAGENTFKI